MGFGHNKEKAKLEFTVSPSILPLLLVVMYVRTTQTTNVSSLDKLTQFIDPRQLTFDLGGSLPYNHEEWIALRMVSQCRSFFVHTC